MQELATWWHEADSITVRGIPQVLDAPAEVVPEMVEMFRLPRIPEA